MARRMKGVSGKAGLRAPAPNANCDTKPSSDPAVRVALSAAQASWCPTVRERNKKKKKKKKRGQSNEKEKSNM